jgi:hypothetical protein
MPVAPGANRVDLICAAEQRLLHCGGLQDSFECRSLRGRQRVEATVRSLGKAPAGGTRQIGSAATPGEFSSRQRFGVTPSQSRNAR